MEEAVAWSSVLRMSVGETSMTDTFQLFHVTVESHVCPDAGCSVSVSVRPVEEGVAVLVDFRVTVGGEQYTLERDLWQSAEQVHVCHFEGTGPLHLECRQHRALAYTDLSQPSAYRDFQVLCGPHSFFVDARRLADLGGDLFTQWADKVESGETRAVCHLDPERLKCLLHATAAYGEVLVHRRNFGRVAGLGEELKMGVLIRAVEDHLITLDTLHPMRKLELGVEMRLARLFERGRREMGAPGESFDKLQAFLRDNDSTLNDVHRRLAGTLNITPSSIIYL